MTKKPDIEVRAKLVLTLRGTRISVESFDSAIERLQSEACALGGSQKLLVEGDPSRSILVTTDSLTEVGFRVPDATLTCTGWALVVDGVQKLELTAAEPLVGRAMMLARHNNADHITLCTLAGIERIELKGSGQSPAQAAEERGLSTARTEPIDSRRPAKPRAVPRRALRLGIVGAAFLAICSLGSMATVASFSDTSTSPITIQSGTIILTAGGTANYPIDFGTNWQPGETVTKTFTMKNSGTLPLSYRATTTAAGSGVLAKKLDAVVKSNGVQSFSGKLNAVNATPVTLDPGQSHTFSLTLTWTPAADDDAYQNTSGNTVITFNASQT